MCMFFYSCRLFQSCVIFCRVSATTVRYSVNKDYYNLQEMLNIYIYIYAKKLNCTWHAAMSPVGVLICRIKHTELRWWIHAILLSTEKKQKCLEQSIWTSCTYATENTIQKLWNKIHAVSLTCRSISAMTEECVQTSGKNSSHRLNWNYFKLKRFSEWYISSNIVSMSIVPAPLRTRSGLPRGRSLRCTYGTLSVMDDDIFTEE